MPFPNKATQFKPGQSGNPKGHSQKRRDVAALNKLIEELIAEPAIAKTWLREAIGDAKTKTPPNFQFFKLLIEYRNGRAPDPEPDVNDDGTEEEKRINLPRTDNRSKRKGRRKADPGD